MWFVYFYVRSSDLDTYQEQNASTFENIIDLQYKTNAVETNPDNNEIREYKNRDPGSEKDKD